MSAAVPAYAAASEQGLKAGPMVGYTDMREAALWVQTAGPSEVKIAYWPKDDPSAYVTTLAVVTEAKDFYTATLVAGPLMPGTEYSYEVILNDKPVSLAYTTGFTTPPDFRDRFPPPDLTVALGSGNYVNDAPFDPPNRIPGGDYSIFLAIEAKRPDLMIWLGNNIFLREADWGSRSGIFDRYSHNRSVPELQPLLGSLPHLAVWSQHEYGPPQADRYHLGRSHATEAFQSFWANPPHREQEGLGNAAAFRWSDVDFFILDDRSFRDLSDPVKDERSILGEAQLSWLLQSLKQSQATFKIVAMGSPVLNPAESPLHFNAARAEREKLLEEITKADVRGIFFISGGKDFGELTKVVRAGSPDIYEITLGPLTNRPAERTDELNYFRTPGTSAFQRHFAILEVSGPEEDRKLTVTVYDVNGIEKWTKSIKRSEM
ncbi:MAG: alkaline phosphatase D family protein [Verrucomicrobiota bacterium]